MIEKLKENIKLLITIISLIVTIISFIVGISIRYYEMNKIVKQYEIDKLTIITIKEDLFILKYNLDKKIDKSVFYDLENKVNDNINHIYFYKYPYGQWGKINTIDTIK